MLLNDQVLKSHFGNWVTGKLSDVFGVYLLPLVLLSIGDLIRGRSASAMRDARVAMWVTGAGFVVVKTTEWGSQAYGWAVGILRVPYFAASGSFPVVRPVEVLVDPTDLLALVALVLTYATVTHTLRCRLAATQPPQR